MDIIVPAAGLSTRFPKMRPKYTLTDYRGKIMLYSAIEPFLGKNDIHIGILKAHDEKFNVANLLRHEFGKNINIVILEKETSGPADTVFQILEKVNCSNKEILIKDCDSFFNHTYLPGNYICISQFCDNNLIKSPNQKSYIVANDYGIVQSIAEKRIISDKFCVGGYKFESGKLYCESFQKISDTNEEIYISNIIQYCLHNKKIFLENIVSDYIDVGTSEEWFSFNNKSVIFCDIDGTIIEAQAKNDYTKPPKPLTNNINTIKKLIKENNQIIFVTARPESARKETQKMLNDLGFTMSTLIMGLLNCKRILINDFNSSNPYPKALAINIERNSDTLNTYI